MVLLYILLGIVLMPVVLLVIPVEVEYAYDSRSRPKLSGRIVWLFGLVRFRPGRKKEKHSDERKRKAAEKRRSLRKSAKSGKRKFKVFLAAIRSEGFVRRFLKLIREAITVSKIRRLNARFLFGLDDPADTGIIYGLLMPGFSFLYAVPQVDIVAVPVFDRAVVEANMKVKLRVIPINYLKAAVSFICSKAAFRAARAAYRAYRQ